MAKIILLPDGERVIVSDDTPENVHELFTDKKAAGPQEREGEHSSPKKGFSMQLLVEGFAPTKLVVTKVYSLELATSLSSKTLSLSGVAFLEDISVLLSGEMTEITPTLTETESPTILGAWRLVKVKIKPLDALTCSFRLFLTA